METSDLVLSLQAFPELTIAKPVAVLIGHGAQDSSLRVGKQHDMGIKTAQFLGSGSSGVCPGSATHQLCHLRHVPHR